jgi:hypothetical protein
MANISSYLAAILAAVYGEDVRGSIHDAIDIINKVGEVVLNTGTAVTGPTSSSTGFYDGSFYINTNTMELWKCIGTDTWQSQGVLKGADGADGNGIVSIAKTATVGLVDTYTITYDDGTTTTYDVTNGQNGSKWYKGTAISGTGTSITGFPGNMNDFYLNSTDGYVYICTKTGGSLPPDAAEWDYVMTLTGGGSGPSITVIDNLTSTSTTDALSANQGRALKGMVDAISVDQTYSGTSTHAQSGTAVKQAIDALDKSDSAVSGQYVSAVSETNGIITVSRASLPSDTKNTAGTTNSTSKLFLAGATTQAANPQTYSNVNCYASGGYLYSNGQKVSTDDWTSTATVSSNGTVTFSGLNDSYGYKIYYTLPSGDSAYTFSKVSKSGSGTSVTLTYTTDAPSGTVCKLRILK